MPVTIIQNPSFLRLVASKNVLSLALMVLCSFFPNQKLLAQNPPSDSVKQGVNSGEKEIYEPPGRKYLLGDWGGERMKLENKGVVFDFFYTTDALSSLSGGYETS